jgi:energy-coupling factor transporter ATP-binding protein EcfA2
MTRAKMAGQRLNRASSRAQNFARSIIEQAEQLVDPELKRLIAIGPHSVEISFASNSGLTELIQGAFIPKSEPSDSPVIKVFIAQKGDGVVLPNLDWAHEWISTNSVIPSLIAHPYRVFIDRNQGIIYCFDPQENRAAIIIRDSKELDLRSFITPFRILWSWIAIASSSLVLHAAAVQVNGHGVLLSGPSGSGKSTLAVSTGSAVGNSILADDCVLVHGDTIYALYSRVKIESDNLSAINFGHDVKVHALPGAPNAKRYVQIDQSFPGFITTIDASVLVFPSIYGRAGFFRLPERRSISMLTSDSMRELFGGTPLARKGIQRLVSRLPAYRLLLDQSVQTNIKNLESLVNNVAA